MLNKIFFSSLKKTTILFCLFGFFFSTGIFAATNMMDNRYSSFASYLVQARKPNEINFTYGRVQNTHLNNYGLFYYQADDIPGVTLKKHTQTFFKGLTKDGFDGFTLKTNENYLESKILLYTPWNFNDYNYNFDICTDQNTLKLDNGEVYITEYVFDVLFSTNNFHDCFNKTITCNDQEMKIKGVITKKSNSFAYDIFGYNFILGNYNARPMNIQFMDYHFILTGDEIETFTSLYCIEGAVKGLNSNSSEFVSVYYDFSDHVFYEGKTQNIKQHTFSYTKNNTFLILSFIIFLLIVGLLVFVFNFRHPIFSFVNIHRNKKINCFLLFIISIASLLITVSIVSTFKLIILENVVINLLDYNNMTFLFFTWIVFVIILIFSTFKHNERDKKPNLLKEDSLDFFELNI